MDGINATSNLLAMTSMRPIADAVTEVQVQTGSTSAEYGAYLGVHVNVVTKAGTNDFHGALFEYLQDDSLESRGYFDNLSLPEPPKRSNQFGMEFDGPVAIPGLYDGRNKTFFMARLRRAALQPHDQPDCVGPDRADAARRLQRDQHADRQPHHQAALPGQPDPAGAAVAAGARSCSSTIPCPTCRARRTAPATTIRRRRSTESNIDQLLFRVDQNISNAARVYVRYNWVDAFDGFGNVVPTTGLFQPRVNKNTLVSWQQTLSPTLLNDFRIGYHRLDIDSLNNLMLAGVPSAGSDIGIPGFDGDVRYNNPGIPTIGLTGFSGLGNAGTNWYQFDTTFQMSNVLSWTKGTHNIRTGFDVRKMATGRRAANDPRGVFNFNGSMTGYPVADFMTGIPITITTPVDQVLGHVGQWRNGFFANDVWQATRNMTLSLGLRYERNTPVQTYEGFASMLNADQTAIIPSSFPAVGFEFHEPNNEGLGPAPRRDLSPVGEDRAARRVGHLLQPQPDELVHVPHQQSADRRRLHVQQQHDQPDAVVRSTRSARSDRAGRRT